MTDRKTLDKAREWAEHAKTLDETSVWPTARAAAEVILSLPHEWVDAFFIHDIINQMNQVIEEPVGDDYAGGYAAATEAWRHHLRSLLPTPTPRTMAEMTPEERNACQWMQVEVSGVDEELGAIIHVAKHHAEVLWSDGLTTLPDHQVLTPRPDLPPLKWPGSEEEQA